MFSELSRFTNLEIFFHYFVTINNYYLSFIVIWLSLKTSEEEVLLCAGEMWRWR